MKKKIICFLLSVFSLSMLVSCINIDTEITFRQDLTGEALIRYSILKSAVNIGKIDKNDSFLPLPVEEQRYRDKAERTNGLELRSFKKEETDEEIYITVRYDFKNMEALNAIISNTAGKKIDIQKRADRTYYTQEIYSNKGTLPSEETLNITESLFADRYIKIKVTAPAAVKSVNTGSSSGNNAEVVFKLPELLASASPVVWEIIW